MRQAFWVQMNTVVLTTVSAFGFDILTNPALSHKCLSFSPISKTISAIPDYEYYDYYEKQNILSRHDNGILKPFGISPTVGEPLFLMDYLCGDGRSTQELLDQHPHSVIVGIIDEHFPKNKNILQHRFPDIWFDTMDNVKKDPVLFDLIQIHHGRIDNKSVFINNTVPFMLRHLSIKGEIHYHFDTIQDMMDIPFLEGKIVRDFMVTRCTKKKTIKFIKCA